MERIRRFVIWVAYKLWGSHPVYNEENYWFYSDGSYPTLAAQRAAEDAFDRRLEAVEWLEATSESGREPTERQIQNAEEMLRLGLVLNADENRRLSNAS